MDVISIAASITTLVALTKEIVSIASTLIRDVQDAPQELLQVSKHVSLISIELQCINQLYSYAVPGLLFTLEESSRLKESLTLVKLDMMAIQKSCEKSTKGKIRLSSRVSWVLFDSKTVNKSLEQLHRVESHLLLISSIMHLQGSVRTQTDNADQAALILERLKNYHEQAMMQYKPPYDSPKIGPSSTSTALSVAFRHQCTLALPEYWKEMLGFEFRFSKAQNDFQSAYNIYARLPFVLYPSTMAVVISFSFRRMFGPLPSISVLGGVMNFVNMISDDSAIVAACESGDTLAVRDLFRQKKAAPNDMTTSDRALLYYATRSGSSELVRFLINAGAPVQPNQLFAASYWRQPGIARLLLLAGVNVEHQTRNGFTAASYLYGAKRPKDSQTEFLEILASNSFSNFDAHDNDGWTTLHRAAAWGTSADVKMLVQVNAFLGCRTKKLDWTPEFVAVCFKNLDTLKGLCECHENNEFTKEQDFRGWNLLHMAAGYGNFEVIPFLIEQGVDLNAPSKPTSRSVPYPLRGKCVTPEVIARCCGEVAYSKWVEAVEAAGKKVKVKSADIDWSTEEVVDCFGHCECCDEWNTGLAEVQQ